MEQKKQDELIAELLSSEISEEKREEIKSILIESGVDLKELNEMATLYSKLDNIDVPEPSGKLDSDFYRSLELYKDARYDKGVRLPAIFRNKYALRFAASVLLVAFGWYLGNAGNSARYHKKIDAISSELTQVKEVMMVNMLDQPSAIKRIKAISYADDIEKVDDRILNAFLNTLNSDPNPNVRLTALEALSKYSDIRFVRDGLIRSISVQESPLVQVALIDLMRRLGEKGARSELQKLLENRELNYSVRNKTRETIRML